jgi:hypothetical protein
MTAIAAVGGLTILLTEERLGRILLPLVAFSAGSLIAGAMLHLIPAALARDGRARNSAGAQGLRRPRPWRVEQSGRDRVQHAVRLRPEVGQARNDFVVTLGYRTGG